MTGIPAKGTALPVSDTSNSKATPRLVIKSRGWGRRLNLALGSQWNGKTTKTNGAMSSLAAGRRTWGPPSVTHILYSCPDIVPVLSSCCGCSLSLLHKLQEACHVAFFLRLTLLRGWEELSEQTLQFFPPAKHSTCLMGSQSPAICPHRHFVTHISKAPYAFSSWFLKNIINRWVSLTQGILQGLCF